MSRTTHILYRSREEWLAARRETIGSSDVPAILGLSPYRGPWDVYADKMGLAQEMKETPEMALGRRLEGRVLEDYAKGAGVTITPASAEQPTVWVHRDHPWATCTPDGETIGLLNGLAWNNGIAEAKIDVHGAHWSAWHEEPTVVGPDAWPEKTWDIFPCPFWYAAQCYWQLEVTGLAFCDIACQGPRISQPVRWHRIMRNPDLQTAILRRVAAWREKHIVGQTPPPADDSAACTYFVRRLETEAMPRKATQAEEDDLFRADQHAAAAKIEARTAKRLRNGVALTAGGQTLILSDGRRWKCPPHREEPVPDFNNWPEDDGLNFELLHTGPGLGAKRES